MKIAVFLTLFCIVRGATDPPLVEGDTRVSNPPSYFNNVDFLALGYDIYEGYPLTTEHGLDPGFKTTKIFDLRDATETTADTRFFVPDGTSIVKQLSCDLFFESETITDEKSLQEHLSTHVSASGGYMGGSFRMNAEYQKLAKSASSSKSVHAISRGDCEVYRAWLNLQDPPKLSRYFLEDVKNLLLPSAAYNQDNYMTFVKTYGTHFVQSLTMGAKISVIKSLTVSKDQTFGSTSASVSAAASYSGMFSLSAEVMYAHQAEAAEAFEKSVSSTQISTIGSKPSQDGDINTWAQQAFLDPMPLTYHLEKISRIFDPKFLKYDSYDFSLAPETSNGENAFNDEEEFQLAERDIPELDYAEIQRRLDHAITEYCNDTAQKHNLDPSFVCSDKFQEETSSGTPVFISQTPTYGYFSANYLRDQEKAAWKMMTSKIQVRINSNNHLVAIRAFTTADQGQDPAWHGSGEGTDYEYILPSNKRITKAKVWAADDRVSGLLFTTDDGLSSQLFGSGKGESYTFDIAGYLIGFHGHIEQNELKSLGFMSFDYSGPVQYATPLYGSSASLFWLDFEKDGQLVRFQVKSGSFVDAIKLEGTEEGLLYGGFHGNEQGGGTYVHNITVNGLRKIQIWLDSSSISGMRFEAINWSDRVGTESGSPYEVTFDDYGKKLQGFYGRAGDLVESIGFIFLVENSNMIV